MDVVKSVVIELRPRLRCCNIFLTTTHLLSQDQLTIRIRPDCIIFNYYNNDSNNKSGRKYSTSSCESISDSEDDSNDYYKFMDIKQHSKLVPGSLTNLKIENTSVSFRVLTEPTGPNCSGNFHSEIVNGNNLLTNLNIEDCFYTLNLEKNTNVTINCSNCSNQISKSNAGNLNDGVTFTRILQLPSECMDMSEWFCHTPGNSCNHDIRKEATRNENYNKFEPSESDVFYGVGYFLLNALVLNDFITKFNSKRINVHCNRCLLCLGSKNNQNNVMKFWNASIKFIQHSEKSENVKTFHMFSYKGTHESEFILEDTINLVKNSIKNSTIGFQIPTTCKIILETEDSKKQYLFLWILDRHLDLLTSKIHDKNSDDKSKEIKLVSVKAAKALYIPSEEASLMETDEWKNSDVQIVSVSKKMFITFVSYLVENSKSIPESFRKTSSYFVSYIYI